VDAAAIARIRAEGLERSHVMDTAFWLSDRYGPRLNGSPEFEEAGDWVVSRLQSWGVRAVHKERFESGAGWSLQNFHATMTAPRVMPIIGMPLAWTPGTHGLVRAKVVHPIIATEADAARYKGKLAGTIVLTQPIRAVRMLEYGDGAVLRYDDHDGKWRKEAMTLPPPIVRAPAAPRAAEAPRPVRPSFNVERFYREEGVIALLDRGEDGDLAPGGSDLSWTSQRLDGGTIVVQGNSAYADPADVLPHVTVAVEQYNRMVRLLDHQVPVTVELDIRVKYTPETRPNGFNVIGELPGSDKADEIVVIGAHLDSWHAGTGATDNAAGCAAMMEAMRILRATGLQPRRTIRLGLWGGEEEYTLGSGAYAAAHLGTPGQPWPEMARTSVYFNLDNGTGRIRGVWSQGNEAAAALFAAWARPLADLGVDLISPRSVSQTDHVPFARLGIPAFQFVQERYEYNARTHHTNMDLYDRLQPDDLRQMATVAAVFAWQAANADDLVPRAARSRE
jgi:hypothetical protein